MAGEHQAVDLVPERGRDEVVMSPVSQKRVEGLGTSYGGIAQTVSEGGNFAEAVICPYRLDRRPDFVFCAGAFERFRAGQARHALVQLRQGGVGEHVAADLADS